MIVEQWEFKIKGEYMQKAKEVMLSMDWGRPYKLLESEIGDLHRLITYSEFESMAEMEKNWNEMGNNPEFEKFLEKWRPIIVDTKRTVWRSIEAVR